MENQTATTNKTKIVYAHQGTTLQVLGDQPTIKLSGADTGGLFTVVTQDNPSGAGIPMHVHDNEDETFHVLDGEIEFDTNGSLHLLKAGDMIFLPRKVPHSFRVIGTQNAKAIVTAYPSGIENMFVELSALPAGPPDFEKVFEICGRFGIRFL